MNQLKNSSFSCPFVARNYLIKKETPKTVKTKPSHLSHVNFPFKTYRNKIWCIAVLYSLPLLLFTSTLYAIPPQTSSAPTPAVTATTTVTVLPTPIIEKHCLPVSSVTGAATNITSHDATLNGSYDNSGYCTEVWFEYGTPKESYSTSSIEYSDSGSVSVYINGLTPSMTYYYRIVAQNNEARDCYIWGRDGGYIF